MMSPSVAGKLSEDQMNILYECAEACKPIFRQATVDINDEALQSLQDAGCSFVNTLDAAELQAATASVYDEYPEYSELVDAIRALR